MGKRYNPVEKRRRRKRYIKRKKKELRERLQRRQGR